MKRQNGSALLLAMLTVVLVASLSGAAVWQLWRTVETQAAEQERLQAGWLLAGALDWARDVLHQDARTGSGLGSVDHLREAWSQPLSAHLSGFLSASSPPGGGGAGPAAVSVQVVDLQARLNFRNVVKPGSSATEASAMVSAPDLEAFRRLFVLLGLPAAELEQAAARLADVLNRLNQGDNAKGADLMPQNLEQMGLLGLSAPTLAALQPYATLLPERSRLNINTASAQAISASVPGLALAQAQALVLARTSAPFKSTDQAHERVPALKSLVVADRVWGVYSEFFEVNARVALGNVLLQERTVLSREDARLKVIRRAYVLPAALGS